MIAPRPIAIALAALLTAAIAGAAVGQSSIMVEEPGTAPRKSERVKKPAKKSVTPPAAVAPETDKPAVDKPAKKRPRGSSTYIPPPVPSPYGRDTVMPQSAPVYTPPKIDTFGDRVIRCNHSFPLNAGIGNNPTDRGSYVRQCAN